MNLPPRSVLRSRARPNGKRISTLRAHSHGCPGSSLGLVVGTVTIGPGPQDHSSWLGPSRLDARRLYTRPENARCVNPVAEGGGGRPKTKGYEPGRVLAEYRLILSEAKAPQPTSKVQDDALTHPAPMIVQTNQRVHEAGFECQLRVTIAE